MLSTHVCPVLACALPSSHFTRRVLRNARSPHAVPQASGGATPTTLRPVQRNTLRYHPAYSTATPRALRCVDPDLSRVKTSPTGNTFKSKDELRGNLGNPNQPCCIIYASDWPIDLDGVMNREGTGASAVQNTLYASLDSEMLWCVVHAHAPIAISKGKTACQKHRRSFLKEPSTWCAPALIPF